MRRVLTLACVVALLPSASCMFFRSLDDLASATSPPDASSPPPSAEDGGVTDAAPDRRKPDGSFTVLDSSVTGDAKPPPEAGSPSPCVGDAGFDLCLDFDDGGLTTGWTTLDNSPTGSMTLDTAQAISPPRSLLVTQPRLENGPEVINSAEGVRYGTFTHARLEFDIFIEPPAWLDGDLPKGLAVINIRSDSAITGTVLFINATQSAFSVEGPATQYYDAPPLATNRWSHVRMDVFATGTVQYDIDGMKASQTFSPPTHGANPRAFGAVGLFGWNPPNPAMNVHFDNVIFDLE